MKFKNVNIKDKYFFLLLEDYKYYDVEFMHINYDSEFLSISKGHATVKKGYAWNGCTPKKVINSVLFGTPDGAGLITLRASLLHDALYQYGNSGITRKQADVLFLRHLRKNSFGFAKLYYRVVRMFGWGFFDKNPII